jgi:hypothetical protein
MRPVPARRSTSLRPLCAVLALALLAAAPAAQLTETQATSALKAALKERLKTIKSDVGTAIKVFELQLGAFEDAIKAENWSEALLEDIFTDANAMQATIAESVVDGGDLAQQDAAIVLGDLADGTPLAGHFPKDFYLGTGGHLDRFAADVNALLAKTYGKLGKRLAKTVKLAEKHGVAVTLSARPPARVTDTAIAENSLSFSDPLPLTADLAIAGGLLATENDNVLHVGGSGDGDAPTVTVELHGADTDEELAPVDAGTRRWTTFFDDGGAGLTEGTFVAHGFSNDAGAPETIAIGVR